MAVKNKTDNRMYYFDYLRVFIITLVVLLHSLLPHVHGYEWYVNDSPKSDLFGLFSLLIDVFIMPIMFFIAGYFCYYSLKKYGAKLFINKKSKRILVPFGLGIVFLSPIMNYFYALEYISPNLSYLEYWRGFYFNNFIQAEHAGHYWFLSSLFVFYLAFVLIYRLNKDKIDSIYEKQKESISQHELSKFLFIFFALGILSFFIVSQFSADDSWVSILNILVFQPTRWTIYILYFSFGIFAYLKKIKITKKMTKKLPLFLISTAILSIVYLAFKINFMALANKTRPLQLLNAFLHFSLCFLIFSSLLLFFKKYLDKPFKILNSLAANSYQIYFFHMIILVAIQYYLLTFSISIFAKFMIVFVASFILSYLLSMLYTKLYKQIKIF